MVEEGNGDDLDVADGRCCPTCRHDLTPHNKEVWNAGYAVAQRHTQDDIRRAYEEGWSAACADWLKQQRDPDYPIGRGKREAGK